MTKRFMPSDLYNSEHSEGMDWEALNTLIREAEDISVSIDEEALCEDDEHRVSLQVNTPISSGITLKLNRVAAEEMARRIRRFAEEQEEERLELLDFWYR